MKSITIVIPNFNGMRYLEGCLKSLTEQTDQDFEILMIDNGSDDGSVSWVREHYPAVRIRAYRRNTGFCKAVNAGIGLSRAKYVLLLNNDVVCDREMVAKLHQAIEQRPRAFSCGAKLLQMADPEKIDDAGDTYSALGWALARGKGAGREHFAKAEKVFACCAACAIYRRSMLEKTGVFDERHFAYLEDIDIGYRAQRFGFENWFIPDAVVYHAGSATSGSRYNAFKVRLAARNSVWLVKKNMPALQAALNLPFLAAGCLIKWIYFSRKGLGKEYAGGIRQGLAGMGRLEGPPAEQYLACWKLQPQLLRGVIEQLLETGKAS